MGCFFAPLAFQLIWVTGQARPPRGGTGATGRCARAPLVRAGNRPWPARCTHARTHTRTHSQHSQHTTYTHTHLGSHRGPRAPMPPLLASPAGRRPRDAVREPFRRHLPRHGDAGDARLREPAKVRGVSGSGREWSLQLGAPARRRSQPRCYAQTPTPKPSSLHPTLTPQPPIPKPPTAQTPNPPRYCTTLMAALFAASLVICAVRDILPHRYARFVPSPMSMSIPFYIGPFYIGLGSL
jgi:hypothetical protein